MDLSVEGRRLDAGHPVEEPHPLLATLCHLSDVAERRERERERDYFVEVVGGRMVDKH